MPIPAQGTNIHHLWMNIMSITKYLSVPQLKAIATKQSPGFPLKSISTHLTSLVRRGCALKRKGTHGQAGYKAVLISSNNDGRGPIKRDTKKKALKYIAENPGAQFTPSQFNKFIDSAGTSVWALLAGLAKDGVINRVSDKPVLYAIPAIQLPRLLQPYQPQQTVPETLPETNTSIVNMSIGDMLNQAVALRDENLRMKLLLENIAQLLCQAGVVNDD